MTDQVRATSCKRLTDTAIKTWLRKAGADALHDGSGLYLRRRAGGAFWSLRQVNPLTKTRTWAGLFPGVPYPAATLDAARRKADEARLHAAVNVTDVVRDRRTSLRTKRAAAAATELADLRRVTVRQLFERWSATELAPHARTDGKRDGRKDGGQYCREQFERRVFPGLGEVEASAVTDADLLSILDAVKVEGKRRTANVLLANLKQMFRFAVKRQLVERNLLETVTKRDVGGKETERDRVLSNDEVAELSNALPLAGMSERSAAAVWLILSTGCRVGEAMAARWEDIDTTARTWHLPHTKNQRPHTIHLSHFALRQLRALAELAKNGPDGKLAAWVFPNTAAAAHVCVKSFGKQLADRQRQPERRLQHRTKNTASLVLPGGRWTAHDLRRTAATLMAELGVSGDVIDECLNHVIESRMRRTYVRNRRLADQARAFDALGEKLATLTRELTDSHVIHLRAA